MIDTRMPAKGYIIVEYYEENDSKFIQTNPETFKEIQSTSYPTIFLAKSQKGKWGIVDAFGEDLPAF